MTPLREQMIKAMQVHGFSPRTHESYLAAVTALARYYHRSPDALCIADLARKGVTRKAREKGSGLSFCPLSALTFRSGKRADAQVV